MADDDGEVQALIKQSDICSTEKRWEEGAKLLASYHSTDNPELLWRIVRDLYRKSKYFASGAAEAEEFAREGLQLAEKCLALDKTNYLCYKVATTCDY